MIGCVHVGARGKACRERGVLSRIRRPTTSSPTSPAVRVRVRRGRRDDRRRAGGEAASDRRRRPADLGIADGVSAGWAAVGEREPPLRIPRALDRPRHGVGSLRVGRRGSLGDAERHRPRPSHLPERSHAGVAERVRDIPGSANYPDRRDATVTGAYTATPTTPAPSSTASATHRAVFQRDCSWAANSPPSGVPAAGDG